MPNYRNTNTNDVVHRDDVDPRLEALDNWERVQDDGLYPSDVDELVSELGRIGKPERDVLRLALAEYDEQDGVESDGEAEQTLEQIVEQLGYASDEHRSLLRKALAEYDGVGVSEPFDPAAHNVDEVNAYLAEADAAERIRVLSLEADESHGGPGRKGILEGPHADTGD